MTPQQIDAARDQAEIDRQIKRSFATPLDLAKLEKAALKKYPPLSRHPQPKIKKHILP